MAQQTEFPPIDLAQASVEDAAIEDIFGNLTITTIPSQTPTPTPTPTPTVHDLVGAELSAVQLTSFTSPQKKVHLFYDPRTLLHAPPRGVGTELERPERAENIYRELRLTPHLFYEIPNLTIPKLDISNDLAVCHSKEYLAKLNNIKNLSLLGCQDLEKLFDVNDIYINKSTFESSLISTQGVVECVRLVQSKNQKSRRAIAVVRPPGHHACANEASGFCFLNHVAIAAKLAVRDNLARKVMIIDWDIHHGNGTQALTYDDPNICFLSLHRFGTGSRFFYPGSGLPSELGSGRAEGMNVNVAFDNKRMDDSCYACAFSEIVLPIANEIRPDLVIISSGFDAVENDLIGDCNLSPEMYHLMTKSLLEVLGDDVGVVVSLEGGYNLDVIPKCMRAVAFALHKSELPESDSQSNTSFVNQNRKSKSKSISNSKLESGRQVLKHLWNYEEENERKRGTLVKGCVPSLNKSISALNKIRMWKRTPLRKIFEQIDERCLRSTKQK